MTSSEVADTLNRAYQAGLDELTLVSVARSLLVYLPTTGERARFIDICEMGGLDVAIPESGVINV